MLIEGIPKAKIARTKEEAIKQGLLYYFGSTCKRGHTVRFKNGSCVECGKLVRRIRRGNMNELEKEEEREKCRRWRKKDRDNNPGRQKEYNKIYREENAWYFAYQSAHRRLLEKSSNISYDVEGIKGVFKKASEKSTQYTKYEVDHIYPIKSKDSCGLHVPWNLQVISREENLQKSNKKPSDFYGLTDYEIWYILQDDLKAYQPKNLDTKE